jgi:hypothetical protein
MGYSVSKQEVQYYACYLSCDLFPLEIAGVYYRQRSYCVYSPMLFPISESGYPLADRRRLKSRCPRFLTNQREEHHRRECDDDTWSCIRDTRVAPMQSA